MIGKSPDHGRPEPGPACDRCGAELERDFDGTLMAWERGDQLVCDECADEIDNEGPCLCCGNWDNRNEDSLCPMCAELAAQTVNPQGFVLNCIKARGYVNGWTDEQFVGRQLFKLAEELSEALNCLDVGDVGTDQRYAWLDILGTGQWAGEVFDQMTGWEPTTINDLDALKSELADLQVVLFCAAQTLGFDIVQAAMHKAAQDVERGVR